MKKISTPILKQLTDGLAFFLIRLLTTAMGLFPLEAGRRTGAFLGSIAYALDRRHRRIAIDNLHYAFRDEKSPAEIRRIARAVFENFGKVMFEACWTLGLTERQLKQYIEFRGAAHLRTAQQKGKGVLALTGHFGNWELLSVAGMILENPPISTVYRPLDFKPLNRFIEAFRARFGTSLIHRRKALRKLLRGLGRGEYMVMLMDQSVDWYEGAFVDFFDRPTCTNKGMALLALKSGAPVVPTFLVRKPGGFISLSLPEIPLKRTGDKIKDVEINTEMYNDAIESVIRQYPEQWFWVHRRWKINSYSPWPGGEK